MRALSIIPLVCAFLALAGCDVGIDAYGPYAECDPDYFECAVL